MRKRKRHSRQHDSAPRRASRAGVARAHAKYPAAFISLRRICESLFAADAKHAGTSAGTWKYLPHLLLAAFIARAAVALSGDFLLHPDEIMQYLEPAHYAAFGNGVLYWEYVHGARVWLIPGAVAGILLALDAIGLGQPAVYVAVVKLFFCLISLLLPWAMYRFTQLGGSERAARLALLLGCFWYELVVMAHKPFTEFVGSAFLFAALALLLGDARMKKWLFAAGVLLALAAAIRMQYAPAVLLLLVLRSLSLQRAQLLFLWGGAFSLAVLIGVLEWQTWGAPFHSYFTNFLVNIGIGVGRAGESSRWQLPGQLLIAGGGIPAIAFLFGARGHAPARLLLLLSAVIFILHMIPEHREYRFIFLLIPCWLILLSLLLTRVDIPDALRRYGVAALFVYGAVALANIFPWQSWIHIGYSNEKPVHYIRHQDPMFAAMRYLAKQDDLRGVFYFAEAAPYFRTGGYYHLHHDVPFYTVHTWNEAQKIRAGATPAELVSHIVTEDSMRAENLPGFGEIFRAGNLIVWRRDEKINAPVLAWRKHVVRQSDDGMNALIARTAQNLRGGAFGFFMAKHYWPSAPAAIEFAQDDE